MTSKAMLSIFDDEDYKKILDRSSDDIFDVIDSVHSYWSFDVYKRKPNVIFEANGIKSTDLDLFTFLKSLENRGAVIKIPNYHSLKSGGSKKASGAIASNVRLGKILNLRSNSETFNFSVKIMDMASYTSSSVGMPKLFTLTNYDGTIFKGWKDGIEFIPEDDETRFICENLLSSENGEIFFKKFISDSRWVSFYSKHYIITKYLIQMLQERGKFYYSEMKLIKNTNVFNKRPEVPSGDFSEEYKYSNEDYDSSYKLNSEKDVVKAFVVEVDMPKNNTIFKSTVTDLINKYNNKKSETVKNQLINEYNRLKELRTKIIHNYVPKLQVCIRAVEYAHWKNSNAKPSWIKEDWETDFKLTPRSKKWDRMILVDNDDKFIAIRKREYDKKVDISTKI